MRCCCFNFRWPFTSAKERSRSVRPNSQGEFTQANAIPEALAQLELLQDARQDMPSPKMSQVYSWSTLPECQIEQDAIQRDATPNLQPSSRRASFVTQALLGTSSSPIANIVPHESDKLLGRENENSGLEPLELPLASHEQVAPDRVVPVGEEIPPTLILDILYQKNLNNCLDRV